MMDAIQHSLYVVSNALLLPALLAILVLGAWTTLLVGGLIREAIGRPGVRRTLKSVRAAAKTSGHLDEILKPLRTCATGLPKRLVQLLDTEEPLGSAHEKCLDDLETDVASSLSKLSWLTRVAPMLGLMGTLIPLGPALTGLAAGDVAALSSNLVVAFTATVVGVLIGCTAFTISLIRKNWYERDMNELEYAFARSKDNPAHGA